MDCVLLQAVLSVYQDGGWHRIREAFSRAQMEHPTREDRSEAVRWLREHTIVEGEDRRAHFIAQQPHGPSQGKESIYRLTAEGRVRLSDILRRMQRISPTGADHAKLLSFLTLNPDKWFSSDELSKRVFQGKANAHHMTNLIRELRQDGYHIAGEAGPTNRKQRLYRFMRMNPTLRKLTLDDVMSELLETGTRQDGMLSIEDVQTRFTHGDKPKANKLLHQFADRLNSRVSGSCRKIISKTRKGAIIGVEFDTGIPESLVITARPEPRQRLPKGYGPCAKHIIAHGGSLPYRDFLAFARDVCGLAHTSIFGCRMVKDGYLIKDSVDVQTKKGKTVQRVAQVRLPDDFPMHLLDVPDEPEPVCATPLTAAEPQIEYCTDRFGYLAADLPDQPVDQFKMWVREIVDGHAGAPRVRINSMYAGKGLWSPELTTFVTPATIELAKAVCHLLELRLEILVGKHVRLGAPEDRTVLMQAMEYGFVPYLLALPEEQRLSQSIAYLHLPTRAFRRLYVENGIRDIAGLIHARESGVIMTGIGSRYFSLVDDAIARFFPKNGGAPKTLGSLGVGASLSHSPSARP